MPEPGNYVHKYAIAMMKRIFLRGQFLDQDRSQWRYNSFKISIKVKLI